MFPIPPWTNIYLLSLDVANGCGYIIYWDVQGTDLGFCFLCVFFSLIYLHELELWQRLD